MRLVDFDVERAKAGWGVRKGNGEEVEIISTTSNSSYNGVPQPIVARVKATGSLSYHCENGYFWGRTACQPADLFIDEDMPPTVGCQRTLNVLRVEGKPGTGEDTFDPDAVMKAVRDMASGRGG